MKTTRHPMLKDLVDLAQTARACVLTSHHDGAYALVPAHLIDRLARNLIKLGVRDKTVRAVLEGDSEDAQSPS